MIFKGLGEMMVKAMHIFHEPKQPPYPVCCSVDADYEIGEMHVEDVVFRRYMRYSTLPATVAQFVGISLRQCGYGRMDAHGDSGHCRVYPWKISARPTLLDF